MPRLRRTAAVAAALVLCLSLAATAAAFRKPTASERRAITQAAKRAPHAGTGTISVSRIHVSTVGPWASATVTLTIMGIGDDATDILHKVHGKWHSASIGTSGEECVMPLKDRKNLGFQPGGLCH